MQQNNSLSHAKHELNDARKDKLPVFPRLRLMLREYFSHLSCKTIEEGAALGNSSDEIESKVMKSMTTGSTNGVLVNGKSSTPERLMSEQFFVNPRKPIFTSAISSGQKAIDVKGVTSSILSSGLPDRESSSSSRKIKMKMQSVDEKRAPGLIRGANVVSPDLTTPSLVQHQVPSLRRVSSMYESHGNVYLGSPLKRLSKEALLIRNKTINQLNPLTLSRLSSPSPSLGNTMLSNQLQEDILQKTENSSNISNNGNAHQGPKETQRNNESNSERSKKLNSLRNMKEHHPFSLSNASSEEREDVLPLFTQNNHFSMDQQKDKEDHKKGYGSSTGNKELNPTSEKEERHLENDEQRDRKNSDHLDQDFLSLRLRNRLSLGSTSSASSSSSSRFGQNNHRNNSSSNNTSLVSPDVAFVTEKRKAISISSSSRSRSNHRLLRQKSVDVIQEKQKQHIMNMNPHIMQELDPANLLPDESEKNKKNDRDDEEGVDCDNNLPSSLDNEIPFTSSLPFVTR